MYAVNHTAWKYPGENISESSHNYVLFTSSAYSSNSEFGYVTSGSPDSVMPGPAFLSKLQL